MVTVVSGSGLGLFGSSVSALGGIGATGTAGVGRGTDRVFVNSATGNLVIQSQDERLSALGLDVSSIRTYNSQGLLDDDNGDNWRLGVHQRVYGLSGALNTAGSTIKKVFGDGREVLYTYDVGQGRYLSTEGEGAHDTLTNSGGEWTWTEGSGRNTETYNSSGQLTYSRDADGNTATYGYTGSLLTQITDASGQITYLDYTGNNLTQIRVVSNGQTQTLTRYYYDSSNRLRQVVLDLSPADNAVSLVDANSDGLYESVNDQMYVTTYTYDGTSRRIASIAQGDGSSVAFTYVLVDGQHRISTCTDGEGRITQFSYTLPSGSSGTPVQANVDGAKLVTTAIVDHALNSGALTGLGGWQAASLLETGNVDATAPKIQYDAAGNGLAVWAQGGDVFVRRYLASTGSWEAAVALDARTEDVFQPQLAVDRVTGNAVVAWVQSDGTANSMYARCFNAASSSWGTTQLLESSAGQVHQGLDGHAISMAGDYAAVTWLQDKGGGVNGVYVARLVNGTWTTAALMDSSVQAGQQPQVAVDSSGDVTMVWRQFVVGDGEYRIHTRRWDQSTQTLSAIALLDNEGERFPRLRFDAAGNGFVAWGGGANLRRWDAATGQWGPQVNLALDGSGIEIAVDANGDALAAWVAVDTSNTRSLYASRYAASTGTWSTPELLETSSEPVSADHAITVALVNGEAVVGWVQQGATEQNIYAVRLSGGVWGQPTLLETRQEASGELASAIDATGNVTVVWVQADGSAPSIYKAQYVGPYYTVPNGASWQSLANTLYGVNSAAAGSALQAAMGSPTLTAGLHLTGLPAILAVSSTVPGYYVVEPGDTWASITQALYGTTDSAAIAALQNALGNPPLTSGAHLTVPTTLSYSPLTGGAATYLQTEVTDATGTVTRYEQNAAGQLTAVTVAPGGLALRTEYNYDAAGNVTAIIEDPSGAPRVTTLQYDANGNLLLRRDALGNTIARTYDARNQLLTETVYAVRDSDGAGSGQPSDPKTTHYVYDAESHLRFVISPEGRVTERQYDVAGRLTSTRTFTAAEYTGTNFAESALVAWTDSVDRSFLELESYAYDFRGNVSSVTRYEATTSGGAPIGTQAITRMVYDQRGQLLQTIDPRGESTPGDANDYRTVYTYDGLGRVLTTSEWLSSTTTRTTLTSYDDVGRTTRTTLANGLLTTRTYNCAGELISVATGNAGTPVALGTTTYAYDAAGRLRMQTDPTGVRQFSIYDPAGRLVAQIDGDGSLTEFVYNRANQRIKTIEYAARLPTATRASLIDGSGNPANIALATLRSAAGGNAANDRITRNVYDASGTLVYTIDALGAVVENRYDGTGRLTDTIRYASLIAIARTVDEVLPASVTVTTNADDRRTRYFHDADGRRIGQLDAEGYLTEYSYNGAGRVVEELRYANQSAVGVRATGTFTDLKTSVGTDTETAADPERDEVTHYYYDAMGRQTGVLDAEGYLTETQYDVANNVSKRIRYDQVLTYRATVSLLRDVVANTAIREITEYTYDGDNKLITEVFSRGTAAQTSSVTTTHTYDVMGSLVSSTRAAGTSEARSTQAQYDLLGRVWRELSAEGSAAIAAGMAVATAWDRYGITYAYDPAGRRISATSNPFDPNTNTQKTNTTLYYYNEDGQLRFTVNALGERTESRYNALGQVTEQISYANSISTTGLTGGLATAAVVTQLEANADPARDQRTLFTYTVRGQLATSVTAEGSTSTNIYDAFGDRRSAVAAIDPGQTLQLQVNYTYDKLGRLSNTHRDPGGANSTETLTYDALGRVTRRVDQFDNTIRMEYDRLGRVIATYDALNSKRSTTYDAFSRTLTTTDANQNTTTYQYDDSTRRVVVTSPKGVVTRDHNLHGEVVTVTDESGAVTTTSYDADGQLTSVTIAAGVSGVQSTTRYSYDSAGRSVTVTEGYGTTDVTGPRVTQYLYDAAGRRIEEIVRNADVNGTRVDLHTRYAYDAKGNLAHKIDAANHSTWYVHDRDNRLTHVVDALGGVTEHSYDLAGRVVETRRYASAITPPAASVHVVTSVTVSTSANDRREQFVYDTLGRRIYHIQDVNIGGANRAIVSKTDYDANGNVIRKTAYANDIASGTYRNPASVAVASSALDRVQFTAYDENNRAVFSVDAAGAVTQYVHDNNGNVIKTTQYATADLSLVGQSNASNADYLAMWTSTHAHAQDRTTRHWYDGVDRLRFTLDAEGYLTEVQYNDAGRQETRTRYATPAAIPPAATTADLSQRTNGVQITSSTGYDQITRTLYDAAGRVSRVTDALSNYEEYTYDALGNKLSYRNQLGAVWTYVHDAAGRLLEERSPQVAITTIEDQGASLSSSETAASIVTRMTYDALGNVMARTEGIKRLADGTDNLVGSRQTTYEYDALGRQTITRYPTVGVYSSAGDSALGNGAPIVRTEASLQLHSEVAYDALGNAFRNRDVADSYSYKIYDQLGRVQFEIDAERYVTEYQYDAFGNQAAIRRYAQQLSAALSTSSASLTSDALNGLLTTNASEDRILLTSYDRLNRKTEVVQPAVANFLPSTNTAGGRAFTLAARTAYSYNAFGNITRTRQLLDDANNYADTYSYYDRRGLKIAEINALGYLTQFEYDETGDLRRQVEYARPVTGTISEISQGQVEITTRATAPEHPAGYDRETRFDHDRLNRKIAETKIGVEYNTIDGTTVGTVVGDQVTTFGYDAVGNQTRITQVGVLRINGQSIDAHTYTYYDVLGRSIAVAAPARDAGNGSTLIPLTVMHRDAFGNLVEEIRYAGGAANIPSNGAVPGASAPNATVDRFTRLLLDSHGRAVRTEDATRADRFASYNERGELAKEWQEVINAGAVEYLTAIYQYDRLGRQRRIIEPQRYQGNQTVSVIRASEYNGFGEIISKGIVDGSASSGRQEFFHYDQAGRLWRTNSGDGVTKVYQHDMLGNVTAEIRSQGLNLASGVYTSAQQVGALNSNVMRTETRYDKLGRIVEQRLPTFNTSSGLDAIDATFSIAQVAGPANASAIYQRIDLGYGPIYVVNPSATLSEGGGYYLDESGEFRQDLSHQITTAVRVTWQAPTDASVEAKFVYRPLGSTDPNAWATVPVGVLADNRIGVNVSTLQNQTFEYRVTYRRRTETTAFAEASGSFRVDGSMSTTLSISANPPDPTSEVAALNPTYSDGVINWTAPGDTSIVAMFRTRATGATNWTHLEVARGGSIYQVNARVAMETAGSYDYEIIYTRAGDVIAKRAGTLNSTGTTTPRTVTVSNVDNNLLDLSVDAIGTVSGQVTGAVGATIARSETFSIGTRPGSPNPRASYWPDQNLVNLQWGNIGAGRVRVEIDYLSQPWSYWAWVPADNAYDEIAVAGELVSAKQFTFESGATGATLQWDSPTAAGPGGIQQIYAVRVYKETSPGVWTQQYSQPNPTPVFGRGLTWAAPADPNLQVSFEYAPQGTGNYVPLQVNRSTSVWGVDFNGVLAGNYTYRITYRLGGRMTAQQTGALSIVNSGTNVQTSVSVAPDSAPSAPPSVATVVGQSASSLSATITSSAPRTVTTNPRSVYYSGTNRVTATWTDLGAVPVQVEIVYNTKSSFVWSWQAGEWEQVPISAVTRTTPRISVSNAGTGAVLSWTDSRVNPGGVDSVGEVRVYTQDAQGNYTVLARSLTQSTPPSLTWQAPPAGVTASFGYRAAGSGGSYTWVTPSVVAGQLRVELTGFAASNYEYYIGYRRGGESYDASGATGSFQVSSSAATVSSQTAFNNAPAWISDVAASGSLVTWSGTAEAGASVSFEYWNGSSWVARSYSSNGTHFSVDLAGLGAATYAYRIRYVRGGQSVPYREATGSVAVNVTSTPIAASVTATAQSSQTYSAVPIGPVTVSGSQFSWSHASSSGDSVKVRFMAGSVDMTLTLSGTGPGFSFNVPQELAAGTYHSWIYIDYYRSGESNSYARAVVDATIFVSYPTVYPTLTITSQNAMYPSGMQSIAAPTDIGSNSIGWTTAAAVGASVLFRYRSAGGGAWTELDTDSYNGTGYAVSLQTVAGGAYAYEILYTRAGEINPYARGTGALTINRNVSISSFTMNADPGTAPSPVQAAPSQKQDLDRWGNAVAITDTALNVTHYRYNQYGQRIEVRQPQVTVISTAGGHVVQTPERPVTRNFYDLAGRLIGTSDANGNLTRVALNAAGEVLTESYADGGVKHYVYDAFGAVISIENELGYETRNVYDQAGRLLSISREILLDGFSSVDPNDVVVNSYVYDEAGRRISETNGEGETTRYSYDLQGNLVRRRTPLNAETLYEYDAQGQKTREQDAIGGVMTWNYDYFGRNLSHTDLGGVTYTYSYAGNWAGLRQSQSGSNGQSINFSYDVAGHLTQIDDAAIHRIVDYRYDTAGRRSRERTRIDGLTYQDTRIEYDAMNRVQRLSDLRYGLEYSYDAQGNRTHIAATYYDHQRQAQQQDLWYTYDGRNRVLISQGVNVLGQIGIDRQGVRMTYDLAGRRITSESYGPYKIRYEDIETWNGSESVQTREYLLKSDTVTERYEYDGLDRLDKTYREGETYEYLRNSQGQILINRTIQNEVLVSDRDYDKASRVIREATAAVEAKALVSRVSTNTYNGDGRLTGQATIKQHQIFGWQNESIVSYGYDAAGVLGSYAVQVYRDGPDPAHIYTSYYTNLYRLGEGYQDAGQAVHSTAATGGVTAPQSGSTSRAYNVNGELISFTDSQNANNNRYFANGANGQALLVIQGNITNTSDAFKKALSRADNANRSQYFFFANGEAVGSLGQLQNEAGDFEANFDVNYTPISNAYPSSVPASVIAQSGDTLRTIAARLFGDSNLWYLLAEENGLTDPDAAIEEGTAIRVPNKVFSLSNGSTSFKPFDASAAIGDTTPTQPMPPPRKGGCGVIGMILVIVVAIVVTYLSWGAGSGWAASLGQMAVGTTSTTTASAVVGGAIAGAAGSVVSQGVGLAIGAQESFSWEGVALSAIGSGVTTGLGASSTFGEAIKNLPSWAQQATTAAAASALTQGVAVATGLQSSFSWREVAIAAVAAPISSKANAEATAATGIGFVGHLAGGLTSTLVRRAIGGRMDSTAVLADVFGNALGNSIVDKMAPQSSGIGLTAEQNEEMYSQVEAGYSASQGQFNDQLRWDLRQQQFQVSLQRDIERGLSNNPEFVANLPMPIAEYAESSNVPSAAGKAFATMWKNAQARAASGDLRGPAALSERDLQNAALNEPYSFLGTYAQARLSGSSMDAVREDWLARANAQAATGEIRALGDFEATLEFNPFARAALGVGVSTAEVLNTPAHLTDDLGNLLRDAYGFSKDAIFGADPIDGPYQAQNSIVRLFQDEGAGRGAVSLITGTVESLPVISLIASGGDPYEMGRSLPGSLGALGAINLVSRSTMMPNGLAYRIDLPEHLAGPDGFTKSGLLSGTHNLQNAGAALSARGANYTLTPTSNPGILELDYRYNTATGKAIKGTKTVYDSSVYSDQSMLDMSLRAGQQAFKLHLQDPSRLRIDLPVNGVNFRSYINFDPRTGVPYIGNVHPIK